MFNLIDINWVSCFFLAIPTSVFRFLLISEKHIGKLHSKLNIYFSSFSLKGKKTLLFVFLVFFYVCVCEGKGGRMLENGRLTSSEQESAAHLSDRWRKMCICHSRTGASVIIHALDSALLASAFARARCKDQNACCLWLQGQWNGLLAWRDRAAARAGCWIERCVQSSSHPAAARTTSAQAAVSVSPALDVCLQHQVSRLVTQLRFPVHFTQLSQSRSSKLTRSKLRESWATSPAERSNQTFTAVSNEVPFRTGLWFSLSQHLKSNFWTMKVKRSVLFFLEFRCWYMEARSWSVQAFQEASHLLRKIHFD